MFEQLKKDIQSIRLLNILLTLAVSIYLIQIFWVFYNSFADIINIFIFGWLLSFVLEPVVYYIKKYTRLPLVATTLVVYILLVALIGLFMSFFVPTIAAQTQALFHVIPHYLANTPKFVQTGVNGFLDSLGNIIIIIPSVAQFLGTFLLILIVSFYLIVEREKIHGLVQRATPAKWHKDMRFIRLTINETFARFLRVQLIFGVVAGIITFIVLALFHVDYALSTAVLAGIATFIPLIGPFAGVGIPVFVALIADPIRAMFVFIILLVMQQLILNVWGPKLLGKAFNLHPLVVLFSFIIGFRVAGVVGGIFAIPVLGVAMIVLHKLGGAYIHTSPQKSE